MIQFKLQRLLCPRPGFHQELHPMMFTNKQPCCGTFTGRNHTTWIFGDAAEVMCTSVIITNVGKKQFTTKIHSRLWHRPNPKFTTFVLAGVSLTNTTYHHTYRGPLVLILIFYKDRSFQNQRPWKNIVVWDCSPRMMRS